MVLTLVYHTVQRGAFQSYQKHLMEGPTGGPATNYDIGYTGAGDAPANPAFAELMQTMVGEKGDAIIAEIYRMLATRPSTLIHGDMRSDNLFRSKARNADGKFDYKIVDWQAVAYGPAGVEFVELLCGAFADVNDYDRLDELLGVYYTELTSKCPQASAYTTEMLKEDFALVTVLWFCALMPVLSGILDSIKAMPDHPFWGLLPPAFGRFEKVMTVLGVPSRIAEIAAKLPVS